MMALIQAQGLKSRLVPICCRECSPPGCWRFKIQDRILPTTSGAIGRQNHQLSHNVTLYDIIGIFSPTCIQNFGGATSTSQG
jgi:hypothetical protein